MYQNYTGQQAGNSSQLMMPDIHPDIQAVRDPYISAAGSAWMEPRPMPNTFHSRPVLQPPEHNTITQVLSTVTNSTITQVLSLVISRSIKYPIALKSGNCYLDQETKCVL